MQEHNKLQALVDLAESLGVAVRLGPARSDRGDNAGGALVKLKGKEILFLDAKASVADQIATAASALRGRGELEDIFLPPEIRELIDTSDDFSS